MAGAQGSPGRGGHPGGERRGFFAQGYVHAQDRLWEMDLSRRAVQGRLAEIFGPDYVDADHFLRTIGFYRAAEASIPLYPPDVAAAGEAYADGVNAFLTGAGGKLPLEFSILGYEPEPWTVTDSAAIGKYMAWVLGGNMESELFYLAAIDKLGAENAAGLFPVYPADGPIITVVPWPGFETAVSASVSGIAPAGGAAASPGTATGAAVAGGAAATGGADAAALASLAAVIEQARLGLGPAEELGLGSNNWVVSGQNTRSGKPLLANDMHLEIKQPSIWYQNHLACKAEGFDVTGVIFPGVPGVIVGHNDRVAWGVTNVGPDVQDLYIERPNPDNPNEFEYDGQYEPAKVYEEEIRVKGQTEPVVREVVVTRHGPIITNVVAPDAGLPPLALRWTALDPTAELAAVLGFDKARNWDDFKLALENFRAPAQNFVFADVDGNIAYRANGLIPIRSAAAQQAGNGLLPVPGWTDAYEWQGYIPWNELPSLYNPPGGVIVTANHRVPADGYPYFISYAWSAPYRAASIWASLSGRTGLVPEDMEAIQNDYKNTQAPRLWPALAAAVGPASASFTPVEKAAWDTLAAWAGSDPHDEADQAGPAIFHTFYLEALRATFADELGNDLFLQYLGAGTPTNTFDGMLLAGDSAAAGVAWFDDVTTAGATETMSDTLVAAFKTAVARLQARLGDKPARWEWGKLHTVTFDHPMGSVAFLRPFINLGPYPTGGSGVTACAKGYSPAAALGSPGGDGEGEASEAEGSEGESGVDEETAESSPGLDYSVQSGAPWRFVADLADLDHCFDVMAVGESGQPFSPHYADQRELWLVGGYKPMLYDRAEIEALPGVEVTTLSPGEPGG